MASEKTILLTGAEQEVKLSGQNCDIRNDSADTVYISRNPNIVPDADGVVSVPVGQAAKYYSIRGSVYLLGTGKVQLCGNDYGYLVFKCAATSSGEGGEVTKAYVDNGDKTSLQLAKQFAEENFSNPNLLINPDFKINQRGQTEYNEIGYTVDRWKNVTEDADLDIQIVDNGIKLHHPGTGSELTSALRYFFENPEKYAGKTLTMSCYISGYTGDVDKAAFQVYDGTTWHNLWLTDGVNTKTIDIAENVITMMASLALLNDGVEKEMTVEWVKLELGSVATPFTPPDPALELIKCGVPVDANPYGYRPAGMGSNPNLLINPDFKINQRGQTEYTASLTGNPTYTVDGWKFNTATAGTLTITDSYVHVNISPDNQVNGGILQLLENAAQFAGKTVTVSAKIRSDTSQLALRVWMLKDEDSVTDKFVYHSGDGDWQTLTTTVTVPEGVTKLSCEIEVLRAHELDADRYFDVEWVKLELGSVATPFIPPDPATELAKCQRYYIPANLTAHMLSGGANELFFFCSLPAKMRTRPSLTSDTTFKMYKTSGNSYTGDEADWTIRVHSSTSSLANGVILALTKEAHGVTAGERYLVITSGGFSAEL